MCKNKAKQFEEDLSTNCDTPAELTKEKARIITLESKLIEKEKEIIQLKEEIDTCKNGARQFAARRKILQLLSDKTALKRVNCDIYTRLS